MTPILHPTARDRLVKLCGLLGSEHAGERANAAALASRLLADCGLTWADVVLPQPTAPAPNRPTASAAHNVSVRWALARAAELPQRDRAFLDGIQRRPTLTSKQATWLSDIIVRLQSAAQAQQQGGP